MVFSSFFYIFSHLTLDSFSNDKDILSIKKRVTDSSQIINFALRSVFIIGSYI